MTHILSENIKVKIHRHCKFRYPSSVSDFKLIMPKSIEYSLVWAAASSVDFNIIGHSGL